MERIGRGGMASVYRARDSQLNRDVAVKVLASFDADDTTFVERFRREAQAVAGLNHPNIIQVHDFGDDKGFSYIVMEYVTGGTGLTQADSVLAQIHRRDDYAAAERAIGAREGDGPGTIWGRGGPVPVFSCRGETL